MGCSTSPLPHPEEGAALGKKYVKGHLKQNNLHYSLNR